MFLRDTMPTQGTFIVIWQHNDEKILHSNTYHWVNGQLQMFADLFGDWANTEPQDEGWYHVSDRLFVAI